MQNFFDARFFAGNRARLREKVGNDLPIVITGNGSMQKSGDEALPFHQDSNFWYLTGLNGADLTLVMHGESTYIIVPGLSDVLVMFDGAHDVEAYAKRSGISDFVPERAGWQRLRTELQRTHAAATLFSAPEHMPHYGIYTLPYRRRLIAKLKRMCPGIKLQDVRTELAVMREHKQPEEIQAIRRAVDITCETLHDIAAQTLPNAQHEYEVEAALSYGFRQRGADGHAFAPVAGAGVHATTLHHMENNGVVAPGDLIVIDVGAEVEHYAADIARTASQTPITGRKAEVWRAVAAAQDYAFSLIKPGVMPLDYEKAVETFIGERLLELGVIKAADRDNIRRHFPHMTSHFLGLDTHDTGDYRAPWEPGVTLAVEPGIYIPDEQIGIRIEDNVLITETGCEILSRACPRELTPVQ